MSNPPVIVICLLPPAIIFRMVFWPNGFLAEFADLPVPFCSRFVL
jgi:hypothetical protein